MHLHEVFSIYSREYGTKPQKTNYVLANDESHPRDHIKMNAG